MQYSSYVRNECLSRKVQDRLDILDREFSVAFRPESRARLWLISSINRNIRAYRLVGVDAWDIITEAYIRAVHFIEKGGLIWNLISWLKSASGWIIHEHRRKYARPDTLSFAEMDLFWNAWDTSSDEFIEDAHFVMRLVDHHLKPVVQNFSQVERNLLRWRIKEKLSWKEIQQILVSCGESPLPSATGLRKRKQRAIQKLRQALQSLGLTGSKLSELEMRALGYQLTKILFSDDEIK